MNRKELIQALIDRKKYKSYLEIGVLGGYVFFEIKCRLKIAVDPKFKFNWKGRLGQMFRNPSNIFARFFETTSDEFFQRNAAGVLKKGALDVVLIDGMHEFKYALNDVLNSLEFLSENGIIILHDCNPMDEESASSFDEWKQRGFKGFWNGDVWKVFVYLLATRTDLELFVADCDHGLGIIKKGNRKIENSRFNTIEAVDKLNYHDLQRDRTALLNLKPESYLETLLLPINEN